MNEKRKNREKGKNIQKKNLMVNNNAIACGI